MAKGPGDNAAKTAPAHPFLSGGLSGVLEITITYPLEFVKNSLQLQPGRFRGPVHAFSELAGAFGPRVFYRGLPSWLLFAFPRSAIRFTCFEYFSAQLEQSGGQVMKTNKILRDGSAGILAGAIEAVTCLAPCQNLSIKITHDSNLSKHKRRFDSRFLRAASQIFMHSGVRGMLAGAGPTLFKNCLNQSIRFPGFYFFSQTYCEHKGILRHEMGIMPLWLCGGLAGALSAVASHPIDVVKASMMGLDARLYRNSIHCATILLQESGVFAFYVGLAPRLTRVVIEVGLLYSFFEQINRMINNLCE